MAIVRAGIAAVDAGRLVERAMGRPGAVPLGALRVLAVGKAAWPMAAAAHRLVGTRVRSTLIVSTRAADGARADDSAVPCVSVVGGHPTPTADSERAGRLALDLAEAVGADEALLVLLSGGASALMAVPADGLTLEDKRMTTDHLLRAGADIHALNTVRKHLSAIKGGRLAARTRGICRAFVISDVVGDDPSVIGSGPTVADASTFEDALSIIRRFGGDAAYPRAVVARLEAPAAAGLETPKPDDRRLARATTSVVGGRQQAMEGAVGEAKVRGYHVIRMDDAVTGEARVAGPSHLRAALARAAEVTRPVCIVSSGETTVRVRGGGKGGRNQEVVLSCAAALATLDRPAVAASVGTDGIDGPTDAAGALADGTTLDRARALGLQPDLFLDQNDAYRFFDALGDLIHTGPTGTNVGDLQTILLA